MFEKFLNLFQIADLRFWMYNIASAALYLLAGYGLMTGELVMLWSALFAAMFNIAAKNVDRQSSDSADTSSEDAAEDTAESADA